MPPEGSGIHPAEAAEHHLSVAVRVVHEALERKRERGSEIDDLDAIAYSMGPGLGPCLRVGAVTARTLSLSTGKPLVAVNHAVGHIELGCLLTGAKTPLVLLDLRRPHDGRRPLERHLAGARRDPRPDAGPAPRPDGPLRRVRLPLREEDRGGRRQVEPNT